MDTINSEDDLLFLIDLGIDYDKSQENMKGLYNDLSVLISNLVLPTSHIKLAKSQIHGFGLVAETFIPADTIVTFYPAHAYIHNDTIQYLDESIEFLENLEHYQKYYSYSGSCEYGEYTLIGNSKNHSTNFMSHMLNDGAGLPFHNIPYDTLTKESVARIVDTYQLNSLSKNNCSFNEHPIYPLVWITTDRDIQPNEELTIAYQPPYWFETEYGPNKEKYSLSLYPSSI